MKTEIKVKQPRPWAKCADCNKFYSDSYINKTCESTINNRKCGSLIMSELKDGLWAECYDCRATGMHGKSKCQHCHGEGWLYLNRERLTW